MMLEALHEFVCMHNRVGELADDVRVHLDLAVKVAGNIGKVVERTG